MKYLYGKNHNQTDNFEYITWEQLCELVENPMESEAKTFGDAKKMSRVIAATDAPTKLKADVLLHDSFSMLRLDLDETQHTMKTIKSMLFRKGIHSYIIHSTAKHKQVDIETGEYYGNRYRVFIQLATALNYRVWEIVQKGLEVYFDGDSCANRPQQIMYLPTMFEGINYEYHIQRPEDCPDSYNGSRIYDVIGSVAHEWENLSRRAEQKEAEEALNIQDKPKKFKESLVGNSVSIIDTFNDSISWDEVLRQFGYTKKGARWLSPESKSGIAGGVILASKADGKQRYYTHSQSEQSVIGTRAVDKFDFLCLREFMGNEKETVRALAEIYFPDIDKHNKREYMIAKHNAKVGGAA